MNLNAMRQAEVSQKIMELQREDAVLALNQNQSMKRLTVVNMVYLPATFIAVSGHEYGIYTVSLTRCLS